MRKKQPPKVFEPTGTPMGKLSPKQYVEYCVKIDAPITATMEGGVRAGFSYEEIAEAIREYMEDNDL